MDDLTAVTDGCIQQRGIVRIINHPSYSSSTLANDVSLLELDAAIDYTPVYQLAHTSTPAAPAGTLVTVAGWGTLTFGGVSPDVAHHVQVPIVDQVTEIVLMWVED